MDIDDFDLEKYETQEKLVKGVRINVYAYLTFCTLFVVSSYVRAVESLYLLHITVI